VKRALSLVLAGSIGLSPGPGWTQEAAPKPGLTVETGTPRVEPEELDRKIQRVLERREYAWRMPRGKGQEPEESGWLNAWLRAVRDAWRAFLKNIDEWFSRKTPEKSSMRIGGISLPSVQNVLYLLVAVIVFLLIWWAWRRRTMKPGNVVIARAADAVPDLHSEDVTADQLPEDRWLQLSRELFDRGDLRLALRAMYLAVLAHLGQRELLAIARHKSNLDYRRELARRAAQRRALLGAFEENVRSFESSWYGRRPVTPEGLEQFTQNFAVIREGGRP
jgi:hypothetical protein